MMRSKVVLPQARGPEQGDQFAGRNVDRNVVERLEGAELLADVTDGNAHGSFSGRFGDFLQLPPRLPFDQRLQRQRDDGQQASSEATAKAAA
jgi:hypothetical protein